MTSLDIVSFDGGLDQRGDANIRSNSFTVGRNVMVNGQGLPHTGMYLDGGYHKLSVTHIRCLLTYGTDSSITS